MVTEVYGHIIDEDRRKNAQRMEDAFYNRENEELIAIVADYIGVPADAVRRDYYIVQMMQNL